MQKLVCFQIHRFHPRIIVIFLLTLTSITSRAQSEFSNLEHLFTAPKSYVSGYTSAAPSIDGDINDSVWHDAQWTEFFTDIEGDRKPAPTYDTRVKMLWDSSFLYIAAELQEPHVWATLQKHDEVVFYDNDFEVFIDPDNNTHQYFEIEVNALNTIFDLFLPRPYRNNTGVLISWDTPGLKSAVKVLGTLNKSTDTDKGWTVEMAIPLKSLTMGNHTRVPKEGDVWRINFSRVQWDTEIINEQYIKKKDINGKRLPEHNWVWSPQGVINMHYPERWGYLQFTTKKGNEAPAFELPYSEMQRKYLWLVYYRQKQFFGKNKRYASSLSELNIGNNVKIAGVDNTLEMDATKHQFTATINSEKGKLLRINNEGLIH